MTQAAIGLRCDVLRKQIEQSPIYQPQFRHMTAEEKLNLIARKFNEIVTAYQKGYEKVGIKLNLINN